MNAAPLPENADDDEIESVAEELLGVDFSSTDELTGPIDLDDDDLFGDDFDAESEEPAQVEPAGVDDEATAGVTADAETEFDDDFGGGLDEDQPVEAQRAAAPQPKSDSYWDALEGWDWDEGASRGSREDEGPADETAAETAEGSGDEPQRPPAKKVDAFLEDDEFGAGLLEETSRASGRSGGERRPPPERRPPAPERRPEPERPRRPGEERERRDRREGERRPERGGRRRGRPDGRERGDEGRRESREERETPPRPAAVDPHAIPEPVAGDDQSDFGAGLEVVPTVRPTGEETPDRGPRPGRRRRGRGRGRGRDEQQAVEAPRIMEETREAEMEPGFDFEPEEGEVAAPVSEADLEAAPAEAEPESRYQDVPTWAEAISYLVNPKAKSAPRPREGSPGSGEGEPRGGSRRASGEGDHGRHRGGSRRRGRGRGRRPPSSGGGDET